MKLGASNLRPAGIGAAVVEGATVVVLIGVVVGATVVELGAKVVVLGAAGVVMGVGLTVVFAVVAEIMKNSFSN